MLIRSQGQCAKTHIALKICTLQNPSLIPLSFQLSQNEFFTSVGCLTAYTTNPFYMLYKYIVSVLALCSTLLLHSQELPYIFQVIQGFTYVPLTGADTVETNGPWDDPILSIPIGFDFPFFGETIDTLHFNAFVGAYLMSNAVESPVIIPYGTDLTDRGFGTSSSQSPILYKIDREAPNRIFKMEWQNAGFYGEQINGIDESFINCQLWLYETSGAIEYCFGPSNIVAGNPLFLGSTTGPYVGISERGVSGVGLSGTTWFLQGDPVAPELVGFEDISTATMALDSTPPANTIYQFIPVDVTDVKAEELAAGIQVYPNPVVHQLQVELDLDETPDQLEIRLFNALGQQVHYQKLGTVTQSLISIDMKQLPKGSYTVQLRDGKAQYSKMIIKS